MQRAEQALSYGSFGHGKALLPDILSVFMKKILQSFIQQESASGILLLVVAVVAVVLENSFLHDWYHAVLHFEVGGAFLGLGLRRSIGHWINDGLMVIFFLLVGLEMKREIVRGHLSTRAQLTLPAIGAAGGMLFPALIYLAFNSGDAAAVRGWAIPSATDIAFALGVLSLLGRRVPLSLKVFLTALAIMDDLGAVLIIAFFYTTGLHLGALAVAGGTLLLLALLNARRVTRLSPYLLLGVVLWLAVLESGVHATVAGVLLAFTIPLRNDEEHSPLERLEHRIHPWVAFGIMPLFALANAGLSFEGLSVASLTSPVAAGIALGLFVGKQVGVMLFSYVAIKSGVSVRPAGSSWAQLYGVAILTGIGFTMSLFVALLAFRSDGDMTMARLGVLSGSLLSAVCGYLLLRVLPPAADR